MSASPKIQFTNKLSAMDGVKVVVYGQSGVGKTSLATTAEAPLILSAEKGLLSVRRFAIPFIDISTYNELDIEEIYRRVQPVDEDERQRIPVKMPYIVIFVDEMNDLMMTMKKEVEGHIIRLAQKSRAAGLQRSDPARRR